MGERRRKIEWQIIRLRAKGDYVERVDALDEGAAITAALELLDLEKDKAKDLLLLRR